MKMTRVAAALITMAILGQAAQDDRPFKLDNPQKLFFPEATAAEIYFVALQRVAREIDPQSPPHLNPKVILHLGGTKNTAEFSKGITHIYLEKWNRGRFTFAIVLASYNSYTPTDSKLVELARSINDAVPVDVEELKQH